MSNGMKPVRRIVTIDDEEGKSLAIADGPSPDVRGDPARPGFSSACIWVTDASPVRIGEYRDAVLVHPHTIEPPRPCRSPSCPKSRFLRPYARRPRPVPISDSVMSSKKLVILSCSEAPTTPGAIARTDPAGLPFHHMTAHNDGKILIADRHTHRTVVELSGRGSIRDRHGPYRSWPMTGMSPRLT